MVPDENEETVRIALDFRKTMPSETLFSSAYLQLVRQLYCRTNWQYRGKGGGCRNEPLLKHGKLADLAADEHAVGKLILRQLDGAIGVANDGYRAFARDRRPFDLPYALKLSMICWAAVSADWMQSGMPMPPKALPATVRPG